MHTPHDTLIAPPDTAIASSVPLPTALLWHAPNNKTQKGTRTVGALRPCSSSAPDASTRRMGAEAAARLGRALVVPPKSWQRMPRLTSSICHTLGASEATSLA